MMSMELEVVELLPVREELAVVNAFNFTAIGFVAQGNLNGQLGLVNVNLQSNNVSINSWTERARAARS